MKSQELRTSRIEARISPEALAIIRRAAELQGSSISDFVVAAAHEAAQKIVAEAAVIRLSVEGQRQFVEAILNPPPPNAALKRALKLHSELFVE